MKKVNFAIYGCGFIAGTHADAVLGMKEASLVGCADIKKEAAIAFAERYGITAYADFEVMLNAPEVDVVCICTPSGTHADLAIAALEHKKHVVLEKPMAITYAECERIIEASDRTGAKVAVISQLRTSDGIRRAKEIIDSGALGRLVLCDLYMKYYRTPDYYKGSWKGTKAMDGGGALMNQGIHGIDMLITLVGMPKRIKSMVGTKVHDIEVEDTAVALLEFENGAFGVVEGTTSVTPGQNRRMELHGTRGTMIITENTVTSLVIDGVEQVEDVGAVGAHDGRNGPGNIGSDGHRIQLQNLVSSILRGEELIIDARGGSKPVWVIEGIYMANNK